MTTIRPATPNDARAIAHVHVEAWQTTYRRIVADEFLDALSVHEWSIFWSEMLGHSNEKAFVVQDETENIIGFANGGPERTGRTDYRGELFGIYLLEKWRGQRIGHRLVGTVVKSLLDASIDSMIGWVLRDNPYRRFYETLGGKLVDARQIQIGEQMLVEIAYGWDDVGALGLEIQSPVARYP